MKIKKSWFLIFLVLFCYSVQGISLPDYKDKYVNDFAEIFSQEQITELRTLLSNLEMNTTAEVSIATIPECEISASEYANKLFNKWGIGKKEKDNGLLILYCKKENKIWIETGYGLEGILPDSKLGRMLDENYVPKRDNNETDLGIISFAEEANKVIEANAEEVREGKDYSKLDLSYPAIINIGIFLFMIILIIRRVARFSKLETEPEKKNYKNIPELKQGKNIFMFIILLILGVISFLFYRNVILILFIFILWLFVTWRLFIRIKCPKCKERLKKIDSDYDYRYYQCKNGHKFKAKNAKSNSFIMGGGFGGGFGGGHGGFGGGASGGGGAGR